MPEKQGKVFGGLDYVKDVEKKGINKPLWKHIVERHEGIMELAMFSHFTIFAAPSISTLHSCTSPLPIRSAFEMSKVPPVRMSGGNSKSHIDAPQMQNTTEWVNYCRCRFR